MFEMFLVFELAKYLLLDLDLQGNTVSTISLCLARQRLSPTHTTHHRVGL